MKILKFIVHYYAVVIIALLIAIVWNLSLPVSLQIVFTSISGVEIIALLIKVLIENDEEKK